MTIIELKRGDRFRTLLSKREGIVTNVDRYGANVRWADGKGPNSVHANLIVDEIEERFVGVH